MPIFANTLAFNVKFHHLSWFNLIPSGGEKLILEPFPSTPRQKQFGVQSTSSEQKEENEVGDIVISIASMLIAGSAAKMAVSTTRSKAALAERIH